MLHENQAQSIGSEFERLLRGLGARQQPNGRGWTASCPVHQDETSSLSIEWGSAGPLVKCFAGCSRERVIQTLRERGVWGHERSGTFTREGGASDGSPLEGNHPFTSFSSYSSPFSHTRGNHAPRPFPSDALPPIARSLVESASRALQCPPEFAALPLLSVTGGVIGHRHCLELKAGWREYPSLWTGIIAPPGTAKSAAQALALEGAIRLQRDAYRRNTVSGQPLSGDGAKRREPDGVGAVSATQCPAPLEHVYTTSTTVEALVQALSSPDTPGLCVAADELSGWLRSHNSYKNGGDDRQQFLSMWSAKQIKSDRVSRGTIVVEHPVVGITGGLQPGVVGQFVSQAAVDDGLASRFLFAMPDTRPMRWTDDGVAPEVVDAVYQAFSLLRSASPGTVTLTLEARAVFKAFLDANADAQWVMRGALQQWHAKLPSQVARLALVLHCLEHSASPTAEPLDEATMQNAVRLSEYFASHAQRVLGESASTPAGLSPLAHRVFEVIERAGGGSIALAELHRALGGHTERAALREALGGLERNALIERVHGQRQSQGRPSERYRLRKENEENARVPPHGGLPPRLGEDELADGEELFRDLGGEWEVDAEPDAVV